uniref:DUF6956 domain-containing protein n=1 Tax=Parabacteroides distasonis TaxID=823 RepID=UPI003A4D4C38
IFTGLMVTGVIEDTEENEHTIEVKVRFDHPHQWGDDLYNDVWAWGRKIVCSLQGWVNSYESVRFVAIDDHTAIITGEYNMEQVKVWLEKYTSIKSLKTS